MLNHHAESFANREQGVGLIEVLVAVLILTVGILGLIGLQTRSLQLSQESLLQSQALMMAYEMTDRIRANKSNADNYAVMYGENVTATKNCTTGDCDPDQLALYELSDWKTSVVANLPSGDARVVCDTTGVRPFYTISVRFQDTKLSQALSGGTGAAQLREVSIRTEI